MRQSPPPSYNAPVDNDNGGLLGGLGGIIAAILGKKILVGALIIAGLLVLAALGVNVAIGRRSFGDSLSDAVSEVSARASPYVTEANLAVLAHFVQTAIEKFE